MLILITLCSLSFSVALSLTLNTFLGNPECHNFFEFLIQLSSSEAERIGKTIFGMNHESQYLNRTRSGMPHHRIDC